MIVLDNCCAIRGMISEVFPNTHVALNVWHFMMWYSIPLFPSHTNLLTILLGISRYLTSILDGPQNPHYVDV